MAKVLFFVLTFSFSLHFHTYLIKFFLWLKVFHRQMVYGGHRGVSSLKDLIGSCSVTLLAITKTTNITWQNKLEQWDVTLLGGVNVSHYQREIKLLVDTEVKCYLRFFFVLLCPMVELIELCSNTSKNLGPETTLSLQKLYLGHPLVRDPSSWSSGWEQSKIEVLNISCDLNTS